MAVDRTLVKFEIEIIIITYVVVSTAVFPGGLRVISQCEHSTWPMILLGFSEYSKQELVYFK